MYEARLASDLGHLDPSFVDLLRTALSHHGAIFVDAEGFPWERLRAAYEQSRLFFALDSAIKSGYLRPGSGGQRGYDPPGGEVLRSGRPQPRETFHIGRPEGEMAPGPLERFGPNVWPDAEVPGLRPAFVDVFEALDRLTLRLLDACSLLLEQPIGFLRELSATADTSFRTIGTVTEATPATSLQTEAHTDFGLFTLLPGATAGGLQLQSPDGHWVDVPSRLGSALLFQAADFLELLSNGVFRSAPHQVVRVDSDGAPRISSAFFVQPSPEEVVSPLAEWVQRSGEPAKYPTARVAEHLRARLAEARGDTVSAKPDADL